MPGLDRPWDEPDGDSDSPKSSTHSMQGDGRLGRVGVLTREERIEHAARYRAAVDAVYRASVVERESGRVMRFPSIVPPTRIVEEYNEVLCYARPRD